MNGIALPPESCPHCRSLQVPQEFTAEVHSERLGEDFLITCTPIRDKEGLSIGSVLVARDITERGHGIMSASSNRDRIVKGV